MILPKKIFSSLTDWTKANYTSWGWTGSEKGPIKLSHESGTCEVTAINNLEVECKPTSGNFGDYFQLSNAATSSMAVCIEFIFDTEEHAKALADYQKIFYFAEGGEGKYNELTFQQSTHVFAFGNLSGTVQWKLVDLNGSAPTSYTILKKVRIRIFDPYIVLKSHLKPISVGDKLGLVYWDGTFTPNTGASIQINRSEGWAYITARNNTDKGLSLYNADGTRTLLDHVGTINLSGLDATVKVIEDTNEPLLKDHLFHVI